MKKGLQNILKYKHILLFSLFLLLGVGIRIFSLGKVPGGINQDEAFAGYEAYSILHYKMDSSGNHLPMYLNTWGSGMNALNSYLMIPFIALFGLKTWVIRLPQCIVACASLIVFYLLLKKITNKSASLTGLFFLSVCPWHIMMSRWGLESNLAPGFILFGLYFFILGTEQSGYFIASAFFYGLSLYSYATLWPVLPMILLLQLSYCIYVKKLHFDYKIVIGIFLFVLMSIPILLFVLVNKGILSPIVTSFITIPRLTYWRGSEVTLSQIPQNLYNLMHLLYTQNDGLYWNSTHEFGLYYKGSLLFGIIGLLSVLKTTLQSIQHRTWNPTVLMLPGFLGGILLGCLIHVNVNRCNILQLYIVLFCVIGGYKTLSVVQSYCKQIYAIMFTLYFILFCCFTHFYFTTYKDNIGRIFQEGLDMAMTEALTLSEGDTIICIASEYQYPKALFYARMPVTEYLETVEYINYPAPYMYISHCGNLYFGDYAIDRRFIYITTPDLTSEFEKDGFVIQKYSNIVLAYYP